MEQMDWKQEPEQQLLQEVEIVAEPDPEVVRAARYRGLRRQGHIQGAALLGYQLLMNEVVIMVVLVAAIARIFPMIFETGGQLYFEDVMSTVSSTMMDVMGWGYLLAVAIGYLVLRLWKRKAFFKNEIYQKGESISFGAVLALVCIVFGLQIPAQLLYLLLEWLFNLVGLSLEPVMESASVDTSHLSMWLYVCLAGPITEELIFRGLLMRSLAPYGKKFAILTSALLFGLFHGSPIQTPYAFLVGLVLGYVAMEYHILWAIFLHILNNMLLGDLLPRMLSFLPQSTADSVTWALLGVCAVIGAVILIVKRKQVLAWNGREQIQAWQTKAFWRSPLVIILTVSCLMNLVLFLAMVFFV